MYTSHSKQLKKASLIPVEFNRLSKVWGTEEWLWLKSFEIDMALYNREYFTIIERLQKWKEDYGKDTNSNDLPDVEKKNKVQNSFLLYELGCFIFLVKMSDK